MLYLIGWPIHLIMASVFIIKRRLPTTMSGLASWAYHRNLVTSHPPSIDRTTEKQMSREADARRLASGEISREELRRENGRFVFPHTKHLIDKKTLY